MGRLTGGVAHDFNNLLTVVIGALDMILRHPDDAAKRTRMAEAALAAARRGEQLTHQLLAFSRRQPLRPGAVGPQRPDPRERTPASAAPSATRWSSSPTSAEAEAVVSVDPAQFEAALLNLVVNARDAMPDGGRITVTTERRVLAEGEVADAPAGEHIVVRVSDTGTGMDAAVLGRVFEPFFTTKPRARARAWASARSTASPSSRAAASASRARRARARA